MAEFNQFPIDIHGDASITSDDDTFCLENFKIGDIFFYYLIGDIYGSYGIVENISTDRIDMRGAMVLHQSVPYIHYRTTGFISNKDGKWFHNKFTTREMKIKFLGPPKITYEEIRGKIIENLTPIENSDLPLNNYAVISEFSAGCISYAYGGYDGKMPVVMKAKTKLGAIVGWLDWQIKYAKNKNWLGDLSLVDFIGVNEDVWPEVLEKGFGTTIGLFEIEETVMFPSSKNVKSAGKN